MKLSYFRKLKGIDILNSPGIKMNVPLKEIGPAHIKEFRSAIRPN